MASQSTFSSPALLEEEGIWTEEFHRAKYMASRIYLKNGFVRQLSSLAKHVVPQKAFGTQNYLITDEIVGKFYGEQVLGAFKKSGLDVKLIEIPSSALDETGDPSTERFKTTAVFGSLVDQVLKSGITKNSTIISLGGGVVNNICGFLAGTLYRGIGLVHITTTMMGMVDAAIDFKQAVNHKLGKNLLGCYYPASAIIIDPELLVTQSARAIRNGLAEALKHGLCHSTELLSFITSGKDIKDTEWLSEVIKMTISLKAPTLTHYEESDFNEMCPQYGHAVGHSCEFLSFHHGNQALLHGEGVAIGCCVSAEIALIMDLCDQKCVDDHYELFKKCGLPVYIPEAMTAKMVADQMLYDKHYEKKRVTMGLLTEVGQMYHVDGTYTTIVEPEVLEQAILTNIAKAKQDHQNTTDKPTPLPVSPHRVIDLSGLDKCSCHGGNMHTVLSSNSLTSFMSSELTDDLHTATNSASDNDSEQDVQSGVSEEDTDLSTDSHTCTVEAAAAPATEGPHKLRKDLHTLPGRVAAVPVAEL